MQKVSSKVVGLVLAFSMITLLSTPTPTKAQLDPFTGALLFGLAITQAAQIGAALGQASYDNGGGYRGSGYRRGGYRNSRRRYYGKRKREAESFFGGSQVNNEGNLISAGFAVMRRSDPNDCFRRIICDISTGEDEFSKLNPILNFVSDDEEQYVPNQLKKFGKQLKIARKVGEAGKNIELCEEIFQCPFTGEKMLEMMKVERFYDGHTQKGDSFTDTLNMVQ